MTKNMIVLGAAASAVFAANKKVRIEFNDKLGGVIRFRPTDRVVSEDLVDQVQKDMTAIEFELPAKYIEAAKRFNAEFTMPEGYGLRKDKHGWWAVIPGAPIENMDGMYVSAEQIDGAEAPATEAEAEKVEEPAAEVQAPKQGRKNRQVPVVIPEQVEA